MRFAGLLKVIFLLAMCSLTVCGPGIFTKEGMSQSSANRKDDIITGKTWQISFISKGQILRGDTALFAVEVAENQKVVDVFSATPENINKVLNIYSEREDFHGLLELIFLNKNFDEWVIHKNENTITTREEEVILQFQPNTPTTYRIELLPEIIDHYFFYIEKSGGIESLRDVRQRIDAVILDNEPFLAYFNNYAVKDEIDIMDFYNKLFTENTQPPFAQTELKEVLGALQEFLPMNHKQVHLYTMLYLSELSYHSMMGSFVWPLIRQVNNLKNVYSMQVYILTDFDITDKASNIEYINITKPQ